MSSDVVVHAIVTSDDSDLELPSEADSTSTTATSPPSPSQSARAAPHQALSISTADAASSASLSKASSSSSSSDAASFAYFLCLLYAFALMGLDMGLLGPSLLELAVQTSSSIAALSFVFAARSVGLLVGTLVAGYLIDRLPNRGHVILSSGAVLISAVTIVFPLMPNLYLLIAMGWLHGCTMGLVDNTTQVLLIRQYGERVPPFMQALHCAFGFGSLFSPLVLSPFLSQTSLPADADVDGALVAYDPSFHYAWLILGLTGLPCSLWLLYYTKTKDYPQLDLSLAKLISAPFASSPAAVAPAASLQPLSPATPPLTPTAGWHEAGQQSSVLSAQEAAAEHRFQVKVILNVGFFLTLYVGCETGYGSYIYTYAVTQLGTSADTAAYLNSAYWASFAVGRAIGVPVSMRFSPQQMVLADLSGCILAIVINLSFLSSLSALCLGTVLYGLSVGSVYASAINYTEYLVGVNGRLLSYLTFFAALGDAVVPFTMGRLFDAAWAGPVGMMWIVVVVAAAATSVFCFLCFCVASERRGKNKIREDEKDKQTASRGEEEEEQEEDEQQAVGQLAGSAVELGSRAGKRGRRGYNQLTNGVEHPDDDDDNDDDEADRWEEGEEEEDPDGLETERQERELR